MIGVTHRPDGIAVLTIDAGDGPHNTLDRAFNERLLVEVEALRGRDGLKGVVIASAKDSFAAGGDLGPLLAVRQPADARAIVAPFLKAIRALETLGKPVVAALNGSALGGGYELALAAHRRIAADRPDARFGLPEATLGLMPGGGGTQRLPRLIGLKAAAELILAGTTLAPAEALADGLVDEVVPADGLIEACAAWALAHPEAKQPWDDKRFWRADVDPQLRQNRDVIVGNWVRTRSRAGRDDKAASAILYALHSGLERTLDAGIAVETAEFAKLAASPYARNKTRTLFYGPKAGKPRPQPGTQERLRRLGVVGGGQMGCGIAFSAARAGLEVTLLDASPEKSAAARDRVAKIGERLVGRGRMAQDDLDALIARVSAASGYQDLAGADFVIEAVFERTDIKHEVYRQLQSVLRPEVTIASNTSSIRIAELASALDDPGRMIGMHFFAPVEVMKLLEIIVTPDTSPKALDEAQAISAAMRKTQIVVRDGKGFYTSRLVSSMTSEALTLLAEGVPPQVIDNVMTDMGFAVGPASLADLTKLPLLKDIMISMSGEGMPKSMQGGRALETLEKLLGAGRQGREGGRGVYDYDPDGPRKWDGMAQLFPAGPGTAGPDEVRERLMLTQSLEAARAQEEGVFQDPLAADIAAVMGWGYPAHLGGPMGYIDTLGAAEVVAAADRLAVKCGARFEPPASLRERARTGAPIHGEAA